MNHAERLPLSDAVAGALLMGAAADAGLRLIGTYHGEAIEPADALDVKRLVRLYEQHGECEIAGDWDRAAWFKRQIDQVPMRVKWAADAPNLVVNVGKNLVLDTILGASYTAVGPFMGLTGTGTTYAAADTMASHAGWTEVGGTNAPAYSGTRKTPSFAAASAGSKATSAAANFTFTSGTNATVSGCFLVLGTGAVNTIDSTAGVLYSVGTFSGGARTNINSGDQLNVSYTGSA